VYLTHCYKSDSRSKADHIEALKAQGTKQHPLWIPGVGDAKALMVTEYDSTQVIELYRKAGVDINTPDKAVEAGVTDLYNRMLTGRFKVWSTCSEWLTEFRQYHRKDGKIVKVNDHLMDATRYAVRAALSRAKLKPTEEPAKVPVFVYQEGHAGVGWLGM